MPIFGINYDIFHIACDDEDKDVEEGDGDEDDDDDESENADLEITPPVPGFPGKSVNGREFF